MSVIGYVLVAMNCFGSIYDCELKAVSQTIYPTIHDCEWAKDSQQFIRQDSSLKCVEVSRPDKGFDN